MGLKPIAIEIAGLLKILLLYTDSSVKAASKAALGTIAGL
jgi:hypothetical protein